MTLSWNSVIRWLLSQGIVITVLLFILVAWVFRESLWGVASVPVSPPVQPTPTAQPALESKPQISPTKTPERSVNEPQQQAVSPNQQAPSGAGGAWLRPLHEAKPAQPLLNEPSTQQRQRQWWEAKPDSGSDAAAQKTIPAQSTSAPAQFDYRNIQPSGQQKIMPSAPAKTPAPVILPPRRTEPELSQPQDGVPTIGVYQRPSKASRSAMAEGREAFWNGRYDKAIDAYRRAAAQSPQMPEPFGELGNVYTYLGKPQMAAEQLLLAGKKLIAQGRFSDAERLVKNLKELSSAHAVQLQSSLTSAGWSGTPTIDRPASSAVPAPFDAGGTY